MVARITWLVKLFHKKTQSESEHLFDLWSLEHLVYNTSYYSGTYDLLVARQSTFSKQNTSSFYKQQERRPC
jgi:hypothetical protein